jgi:hypothetical protein
MLHHHQGEAMTDQLHILRSLSRMMFSLPMRITHQNLGGSAARLLDDREDFVKLRCTRTSGPS